MSLTPGETCLNHVGLGIQLFGTCIGSLLPLQDEDGGRGSAPHPLVWSAGGELSVGGQWRLLETLSCCMDRKAFGLVVGSDGLIFRVAGIYGLGRTIYLPFFEKSTQPFTA